MDCLSQHWAGEVNWPVPPLYKVNKALQYGQLCKAECVIVTPMWKSAVFWPRIATILENQDGCLKNKIIMGNIYVKGHTENCIFGSDRWKGQSIALHLDFTVINIKQIITLFIISFYVY